MKEDLPLSIQTNTKNEIRLRYHSRDPQVIDEPGPVLNGTTWTFTVIDISAQLPPSGFSVFKVSADAMTYDILSIQT